MSWEDRLLTESELSRLDESRGTHDTASRVAALIEHQKLNWPALREGYEALAHIETRRLRVDDSQVVVQHNPRRIRSTAAPVDRPAIEARRCFLCASSLPPEEKGIAYGSELVILCNPFPILDRHLSIVHRQHIPQKIRGNVEPLLGLAYDLGPDYFVLYNGPECGASAPDHLHFQACSRRLLPFDEDVRRGDAAPTERCGICEPGPREMFELFTLSSAGRTAVIFRGNNSDELAGWIYRALDELGREGERSEPMVNIICAFDQGEWTVYLFPRAKHRPRCFYAEGERRLMVSPGAIDMAGVLVVPEREHFERIGPGDIEAIYSEVSLDEESLNQTIERVCQSAGAEEFQ